MGHTRQEFSLRLIGGHRLLPCRLCIHLCLGQQLILLPCLLHPLLCIGAVLLCEPENMEHGHHQAG